MSHAGKAILVLVGLLVVATGWLSRQQDSGEALLPVTDRGPDAYADEVTIRVMDENGQPVYHLRADHLAWYPESDQLELRQPVLDVARPDGTNWQLTAERGRTGRAGDPVDLLGQVTIDRLASASRKPLKITTSDVTVMADARQARTDRAARIEGPGYHIETQGLAADLDASKLELQSQVKGRIDGKG